MNNHHQPSSSLLRMTHEANDEDILLQQAEDALLDGDFSRALQISHDLLSRWTPSFSSSNNHQRTRRRIGPPPPETPHIHLRGRSFSSSSSSSSSIRDKNNRLPYATIASISLHINGEFSRCGAVLLQSWYELCRQPSSSSSSSSGRPYYYLHCLQQQPTIPIDLLVLWMTLHRALVVSDDDDEQHGDDVADGNVQLALKVFEKLLLLNGTAEDNTKVLSDEDRRRRRRHHDHHHDYRDYCRELIILVFLEWLPILPSQRIQELRAEMILVVGPGSTDTVDRPGRILNDNTVAADDERGESSSLNTSLQFCLDLSALTHEWARDTLHSCSVKLQDILVEQKLQQQLPASTTTRRRATNRQYALHHDTTPTTTKQQRSYRLESSIQDRLRSVYSTWCRTIRPQMDGTTTTTNTKKWQCVVMAMTVLLAVRFRQRLRPRLLLMLLLLQPAVTAVATHLHQTRPSSSFVTILWEAVGLGRYNNDRCRPATVPSPLG
jgi:hypothetical protein